MSKLLLLIIHKSNFLSRASNKYTHQTIVQGYLVWENTTIYMEHSYKTRNLIIAVAGLVLLSLFVVILLPPVEGPITEEKKREILEMISDSSLQRPELGDRGVILEQVSSAEDVVVPSYKEKQDILESLQVKQI